MESLIIYNKEVTVDVAAGIVAKIKKKKELVNLDDELCVEHLKQFFTENPSLLKKLDGVDNFSKVSRSKEVAEAVKWVRRKVRGVYGLFQTEDVAKVTELLNRLEKALVSGADTAQIHTELLSVHVSSEERSEIYPKFYEQIFSVTGKPASILEIASGSNPFSYPQMGLDKLAYIATDLNEDDVRLLKRYFEMMEKHTDLRGEAFKLDLTKDHKGLADIKADMCFAFKVFDLLDNKLVEDIIQTLKTRWIVATFPTKTVTKLEMNVKRRAGFQKMLRRIGLSYKTIEFNNELVYIIDKNG